MRACSVGGRDAKILVLAQESAWNRPDLYLVTLDVDAGLDQKALESEVDQRGGADVQSLNGTDVTLLRVEIGAQDQKPVHVLRERSEELAAFPTRKRKRNAVGGSAHEFEAAITQDFKRPVDRKNQFQGHVEALVLEKSKLDGLIGI